MHASRSHLALRANTQVATRVSGDRAQWTACRVSPGLARSSGSLSGLEVASSSPVGHCTSHTCHG